MAQLLNLESKKYMLKQILDNIKPKMEKTITHLKDELKLIRTGRANPALVEKIPVSYYGTKVPLNQVATISVPNPRLILIQPWNKDNLVDIEAAISESSHLGLTPTNNGNVIRLSIPPLSDERREELVKLVAQKVEQARVSLRNLRGEGRQEIREQKSKGEISEDEMYRGGEQLQKITDQFNQKIDDIASKKEKEIREIRN